MYIVMNIMYHFNIKLSSTATQELNQTGGMLKHLRTGFYMHCGVESQQRSVGSHAEKHMAPGVGSQSQLTEINQTQF